MESRAYCGGVLSRNQANEGASELQSRTSYPPEITVLSPRFETMDRDAAFGRVELSLYTLFVYGYTVRVRSHERLRMYRIAEDWV